MNFRSMFGLGVVGLVTLALVAGSALARRENSVPADLHDISTSDQLKQKLQQDSGKVKLIALLSPVCPACRSGFADMQSVLKNVPDDDRLRAYIIWLPMFPGDTRTSAQTRSKEFNDPRLSYYWDSGKVTGEDWRKVLGLDRTAWDVYFLYGAKAEWGKETPMPDFWMHQLRGVTKGSMLNTTDFEVKLKEMLASK